MLLFTGIMHFFQKKNAGKGVLVTYYLWDCKATHLNFAKSTNRARFLGAGRRAGKQGSVRPTVARLAPARTRTAHHVLNLMTRCTAGQGTWQPRKPGEKAFPYGQLKEHLSGSLLATGSDHQAYFLLSKKRLSKSYQTKKDFKMKLLKPK
jgi:hypothetical protein